MRLHATTIPDEGVLRTFKHSPAGDWTAAVMMTLPVAGAVWVLPKLIEGLPGWLLLVAAPFALVGGLVMLVVYWSLWGAAISSGEPTNWCVKFTEHRVFLNLRTYRNAHFGEGRTVVELDFDEIRSAGLLRESVTTTFDDKQTTRRTSYVELALTADTGPIASALTTERSAPAPEEKGRFGSSSSTRHHHYPVQVTGPRTVRLEALKGLLEAFAEHTELAPERDADLNEELADATPEARALALLHRGQRLEAIRVARSELGLSKSDARDWVRTLDERAAA